MSQLVVLGFDDPFKAEETRLALYKLQREYLIDLEDAVVAVKTADGAVKLNQRVNLTAAGAATGGFWGLLIGVLFLNPLLGVAVGAGAGAVAGALSDIGIKDDFMKELAETLRPGSSALFILVRHATPDRVTEELAKHGGRVLKTNLTREDEEKLREALASARGAGAEPPPPAADEPPSGDRFQA
jgi:uncharacterized membrane protein